MSNVEPTSQYILASGLGLLGFLLARAIKQLDEHIKALWERDHERGEECEHIRQDLSDLKTKHALLQQRVKLAGL